MRKFSRPILLFLFVVSAGECTAQYKVKKEDNWSTVFHRKLKTIHLASTTDDSSWTIKNFSAINFVDARFDTSSIGYTTHKRHFARLLTKENISNYLSKKFKIESNGLPELFCVIQNFRIIEADTLLDKDFGKGQINNKLIARVDVFVQKGEQYRAAFRYDTTVNDFDSDQSVKEQLIHAFTKALAVKIDKITIEKVLQKKAYSLVEIKESILEKYQLPILNDTTYKKGVYVDFKEFSNNNPSYKDYKIKKGDLLDDIYLKDADSAKYLATKIFGYSDGKKIWIKYKNNFFLLHRLENTFHFIGFAEVKTNKSIYIDPGAMGTILGIPNIGASNMPIYLPENIDTSNFHPFVLDMEKGTVF